MVHRIKKSIKKKISSFHKLSIIKNPPKEILLTVNVPNKVDTYRKLKNYLWKTYHIDIDLDEDSDYYLDLFYNPDLRSIMGFVEDFNTLRISARYYADGFPNEWKELIKNSEIEEVIN